MVLASVLLTMNVTAAVLLIFDDAEAVVPRVFAV